MDNPIIGFFQLPRPAQSFEQFEEIMAQATFEQVREANFTLFADYWGEENLFYDLLQITHFIFKTTPQHDEPSGHKNEFTTNLQRDR